MRIYLFYFDGKLDWADVGTKDDIPVEITYSEYLKLKELSLQGEGDTDSMMPPEASEKLTGEFK